MSEVSTGRQFQWTFSDIIVSDIDGMTDVITDLTINLWLIDYDLDLKEVEGFRCVFESPSPENFVQYEDLTPENLRDWALNYYANPERGWPHGKTKWLERQKQKLVERVESRAAIRTRQISAIITDA